MHAAGNAVGSIPVVCEPNRIRFRILEVRKFRFWHFHAYCCRVFSQIITELNVLSVDFAFGGRRNRKCNSNLREVQNPISISISSILERLRTKLFTCFYKILHTDQKRGRLDANFF